METGKLKTWVSVITDLRKITSPVNGAEIGVYENNSIYECVFGDTNKDDGDDYVKISSGSHFTWVKRVSFVSSAKGSVLPTPDVSMRGQIFLLEGALYASDIPYMCYKKSSGNYAWGEIYFGIV